LFNVVFLSGCAKQEIIEIFTGGAGTEVTGVEKQIVGKWSSIGSGSLNGIEVFDDEVITFYKNGTYAKAAAASGPIYDGVINERGKYRIEGNTIIFYDSPDTSDYSYDFKFVNSNRININFRVYERFN
jgi:hypothetical protein